MKMGPHKQEDQPTLTVEGECPLKKFKPPGVILLFVWLIAVQAAPCPNALSDGAPQNTKAPGARLEPIPKAWAEAFSAIRPDPPPEKLTRNSHYWVSDEQRHDLFKDAIGSKGGVFIGLGTDQIYFMAGWARPQILVPLDFDEMVIYLHFAFRVIFLNATTPDQFLQMWTEEKENESKALIKEAYSDRDPKFRKQVVRAYKIARRRVIRRLNRVKRTYKSLKISSILDNQSQYDFVVGLFRTERVFPVRGDLTADKTVRDVAKAANKAGLTVRTLYLSNAEQYFKYTERYRRNMLSLPFDDQSVVIRTVGTRSEWAADGVYEYVSQSFDNFHAWLNYRYTYNVWTLEKVLSVNKKTGSSTITKLPPKPKKKR
jgi:hypothetical protein